MTRRDFMKSAALAIAAFSAAGPVLARAAPADLAPIPTSPAPPAPVTDWWWLGYEEPEIIRDWQGYDVAWVSSGVLILKHGLVFKPSELVRTAFEKHEPMSFTSMVKAEHMSPEVAGYLKDFQRGVWLKRPSPNLRKYGDLFELENVWHYYPTMDPP